MAMSLSQKARTSKYIIFIETSQGIMKRIYQTFFLFMHILAFPFAVSENYESAFTNARAFKKPMLLLFVGSDWSHESRKLLTLLKEGESQEILKNDIILCEIDFPELNRQNTEQLSINKSLKEQFRIEQLPSIVLLSETQEYVTTIGFVPVPANVFARHIKEIFLLYRHLDLAIAALPKKEVNELEHLLADAKSLQNERLINRILEEGMKRDNNGVFALEKYAQLVASGKEGSEDAQSLKRLIQEKKEALSIDARLQSAMLSFEAAKKDGDIEAALGPLEKVLQEVPATHSQLWRIQFLVAKYLQEQNQKERAARYAEAAKKEAPEQFHKQLDAIISGD